MQMHGTKAHVIRRHTVAGLGQLWPRHSVRLQQITRAGEGRGHHP